MSHSPTKLNGNLPDFTTVSMVVNNIPIVKGVFSEINWEASQDPGVVQGNMASPFGYTPGLATGTGSFKMLKPYFTDVADELRNEGWPDFMGVDFDITVSYRTNDVGPNPANDLETVNLIGCRITKYNVGNAKGNEEIMVSCDMIVHRIIDNGNTPFGSLDDQNPL